MGNEEDSFTKEEMQRSDFTSATVTVAGVTAAALGTAAAAPATVAPAAAPIKAPQTQAQAPQKAGQGQHQQGQRPQAPGQRGMVPPAPTQPAQTQRAWQVPQQPDVQSLPPPPPMPASGRPAMGGHALGEQMYAAHLGMPPQLAGVAAPAAMMSSWGWNGFQAAAAVVQPQQLVQQQQMREQELREQELANSTRSRYGFAHSFEQDMLAYGAAMGQQQQQQQQQMYGNGQGLGGPPPPMFLDFNGAAAAQAARAQARAQYEAAVHGLGGLAIGGGNGHYAPGADDGRLAHLMSPAYHGDFPPPGVTLAPPQQGHSSRMQTPLQAPPAMQHGGDPQRAPHSGQQPGRNGVVHHRGGRQGQKGKTQSGAGQ